MAEQAADEDFPEGERVTLAWYEPGEPYYPYGWVVAPDEQDLQRLRELERIDGRGATARVLVHWRTGNWRRWESVQDLRKDPS